MSAIRHIKLACRTPLIKPRLLVMRGVWPGEEAILGWAWLTHDVDGGTCCAVAKLVMYADSSGDSVYQVP